MNELRGRKVQKIESPIPGCLGRMVNLFDLGTAVNGNKLLTDKPHRDGSSLSRSRSDVTRMPSPSYKGHSEAELIMSDMRRSASSKVSGTPMKKLIAREMSKEVEHKQSPPNLVAKLMGLETLPQLHLETNTQRSKSRSYSHSSPNHSVSSMDNEVQKYQELSREFKDVYEMWQSPQRVSNSRDSSPRKGRRDENTTEKQMALIRQKFMEAKRLVVDDSLHQSKEFQEVLEDLSSNKDLFNKFLEESNSFSQQHLSDFQPVPLHSEAKRITVLRPTKAVETEKFVVQGRKNKHVKKLASSSQETGRRNRDLGYLSSYVNRDTEEQPVQPTRIVVLKPSLGKSQDIKAVSSSPSSPGGLHSGGYFDELGDVETKEVAKEITRQVRENLMSHRRNETQSSVLSNGYIGDDSSFDKSDNEDPVGNLSDSEIMSPVSRHSWDCPNRFESPFSPSTFSRASFSPESSVCREAKKRLSERWALMSVTGSTQPHKRVLRTSSTLGEMLALSETKVTTGSYEQSNEVAPETRVSTSFITSDLSRVEMASDSLNVLARSKSVSDVRVNGETPVLGTSKAQAPRELTEMGSLKSSWKVSNLFSFKNKKASKVKRDASQYNSMSQLATPSSVSEDCLFPRDYVPPESSQQQSIISGEEELTTPKPLAAGNTRENPDQPSPISVLFPPFEEEGVSIPECSGSTKLWMTQDEQLPLKSNLIDKSPPIGSIARILSWDDDSCADNISGPAMVGVHEDEDWFIFIETLLTTAGFSRGCTFSPDQLMSRWHLPNSPLDPSLIDKYMNPHTNSIKEFIHEGKRRQQRSTRKLIFDRTNSIISETTTTRTGNLSPPFDIVEHVWAQLKDWLSDEPGKTDSGEDMDANGLAAESLVKDEIVGRTWTHSFQVEIDDFGIEIERRLLQELVEEAVIDLTR